MKCLELYKKKKQALAVRLPSYKPLNILVRFIFISIIAVGALHLVEFVVGENRASERPDWFYYLIIITTFNLSAEFQIVLDNILERYFPVPERIRLRITIQLFFGLLMLVASLRVVFYFMEPEILDENTRPGMFVGLLVGLLFVQMIASSLAVARFTRKWLDSQEEIAEMKQEKLNMDYNSLQDQLNPHFLFNNLSALKSLIIYDQDAAVGFTENFTDVYRYVLQSKDKRLVKFSVELEFVESFIGLHKERLGDGLKVSSEISKESLDKYIAPLTMQSLIENAIKHNVTSRETPLHLEINSDGNEVIVANSLNKRESSYSTKTGLRNLVKRYEMLTSKELVVQQNDVRFEVIVPLL